MRIVMRKKASASKPFVLIFIIIGLYFMFIGFFPVEIGINPSSNTIEAQIHRKSYIPPFKDVDITIPNIKQAIITSSRSSKGGTTYRVELESYSGQRTPITTYYSSGYNSKELLRQAINKAIDDRTEYKHTISQLGFLIFGFLFTLIPSLILIASISQKNKSDEQPQKTVQTNQRQFEPPTTSTEKEKYKNINDSIIK